LPEVNPDNHFKIILDLLRNQGKFYFSGCHKVV